MPHIHEKVDFTVEVFIVHKKKVLLRLHDKYKIWLSVGGHIELHEDPNEAAIREVKEEVGLDIRLFDTRPKELIEDPGQLIAPEFVKRHPISPTHEHIALMYFATSDTDAVIPEKETDVWKWVSKNEIKDLDLKPEIQFYAEKALATLS